MASYKLSPNAAAYLERIWFYGLEHWGVDAADAYYYAFFIHFERLAKDPYLYAPSDIREGYRRSICGKDNVYYRIDGDVVEIMTIIGQQNAGDWF